MVPPRALSTGTRLVNTTSGWVRGHRTEGVWRFLGIPYVAPPVGRLRFAAPQPHPGWSGVLDAASHGAVAPQPTYGLNRSVLGSEDCLHLDVVVPEALTEPAPVVVFFHGGTYLMGTSAVPVLRGHAFAQAAQAIFVSVDYRLGILGFADFTALADDTATPAATNPGLRDQLAALSWVQDNIAAFGGDPNRVTVMGESAGAGSLTSLLSGTQLEGLAQRAIIQSAPAAGVMSRGEAQALSFALLARLGLSPHTPLSVLREQFTPTQLVRAGQQLLWRSKGLLTLSLIFAPHVDGELILRHPLDAFAAGQHTVMPLLIGTNNDEAAAARMLYWRRQRRQEVVTSYLENQDPIAARDVLAIYPQLGARGSYAQFLGDAIFWAPSQAIAAAMSEKADTWVYRFDYCPGVVRRIGIGAWHSLDTIAVFGESGSSRARLMSALGDKGDLEGISRRMQRWWGEFIHGKAPDPRWTQYEHRNRRTLIIDTSPRMERNPRSADRRAWGGFRLS